MNWHRITMRMLMACAVCALATVSARADELRNLKRGEPMPAYRLPTVTGELVDSESLKGSVLVMVCLSAEQRSSEMAEMDSAAVVKALGAEPVKLVHLTADVVQKPYFQRFRDERKIDTPLLLDAERTLYGRLGLIVFPTTIVVDEQGRLAHVISLHGPDYNHVLDAYIRHALGKLTDAQLEEALKARPSANGSPKSLASAHRAAARMLHEKGLNDAAVQELNKAREQDPTNPDVLLDLADIDLAMGSLEESEKLVVSVLESQPANRRAKQLKGIALFKRNNLAEAETVLLEALALNPEPARVHYYLGRIYEQKGDTPKALEHYREALGRFLGESDLPATTTGGK